MTVIAHGSVQVYGQQGRYQLYVDRLEPSGVGALALGIEQLKQQLSAEGLFDERRKRALPLLPRRVVVVTSRSGAALRDVCTVIARRAPCIGVVLSPATVQGDGAVETLIRALQRADRVRDADVILLVRGGGSLEDLIAFNSESLARAIRATRLPVVTGVGHETDTTVADLAADRRGATPSAAAELVAPSVAVLRDDVAARHARLGLAIAGLVSVRRDRVHISSLRLRQALMQETSLKRRALDHQTARFAVAHPSRRVEVERLRLQRAAERLQEATVRVSVARRAALTTRSARLAALSPSRTLERGYSITSDADGRVLTDAATVPAGTRLRTVLRHGSLESTVDRIDPGSPPQDERMYDSNPEPGDA
jgi:exodeoxyribonuclease VII large subunit